MINFEGRSIRVYDPRINLRVSEKTVFATLKSSRKDSRTEPPTYHRSVWYDVAFVGDAFEPAKAFKGGELIDVLKGCVTREKKGGTFYLNMTVFEFALSQSDDAPEKEQELNGNDDNMVTTVTDPRITDPDMIRQPASAQIIIYAHQTAEIKGCKLTPMTCAFFVRLFRLVQFEGKESPEKGMHQIQCSYSELAWKLGYPYGRVCISMRQLAKIGLIEREAVDKKTYVTYVNLTECQKDL